MTNALNSRYLDRAEPDAYPQPGRSITVALGTRAQDRSDGTGAQQGGAWD